MTRGLAAHGVCTASQLRFQRVPRRVCPTCVQGLLAASPSCALTRGQRVRARALTRGLAVHGVCTASQLRFQRGPKTCVHGATCVQGVCARRGCTTCVQGLLTARSRRAPTCGQRVHARAMARGLAVHGVCTASRLRFRRGPKAYVHGATCVQWFRKGRVTDASDDIDQVSGEARNPGPQPPPLDAALTTTEADWLGDELWVLVRGPNGTVPWGYSHSPYSQVPGWAAVSQLIATDPNAFGSQRAHSALVAFNVCAANLGVHTLHRGIDPMTGVMVAAALRSRRHADRTQQTSLCTVKDPLR
ncbi:hypothetical protein RI054_42g150030 [Pseudoscourfieldia marina]